MEHYIVSTNTESECLKIGNPKFNNVMAFIVGWNKFNLMFENDILQNNSPKHLGVLKGYLEGFDIQMMSRQPSG